MQVIFAVSDVRQSVAFYEQAFGWPRNQRIDYSNYVEFVLDGGSLGLYERSGYAEEVGAEHDREMQRRATFLVVLLAASLAVWGTLSVAL